MGKYKWKEFNTTAVGQGRDKIRATINRKGRIYLNRRAATALGEPDHVVLMYDSYHQTIGVRALREEGPNAFRARRDERAGGIILYTSNFCREFGIKPKSTLAFVRAEVDSEGVLILSIRDTLPIRRKQDTEPSGGPS